MKKIIYLALTGTMLLAGVSCQRETVGTASGENEGKEVTTQFVLNIASAPTTKMTADVVQQNSNFRGIEHAVMYSFKTGMTATPYVLNTNMSADKTYDFGIFAASSSLDPSQNQTGASSTATTPGSKRVLQLSIPVNTDAVLFYGKAIKASGVKDSDYGATNTMSLAEDAKPSEIRFAAKKILDGDATVNSYDATARLMIYIINDIMDRPLIADATSYAAQGWTLPAVTWAQYGHRYEFDKYSSTTRYPIEKCLDHSLEGLEEVLGKCYYLFTYIRGADATIRPNGEYRAGSSSAMKSMVIDMYKVISAANTSTPTTANEANAKRMAKAILDRASLFFDMDTGEYNSLPDIKSLLISYNLFTNTTFESNFGGAKDLNGYPHEDFGVPEGAAQLGFHYEGESYDHDNDPTTANIICAKDQFYYYHPNKPLVNPTMTVFEPRKYVYPAELMYYVNSPIRTTESDVTIASYPDGVTPWATDGSWTGWTFPGKVSSSTRGVAVAHNINYGVAMLKSAVAIKSGTTYFEDNRAALTNPSEAGKTINVSDAQLTWRGILVGGVNPRMNWQFTRYYTSGSSHESLGDLSKFDGVIYDHSLVSGAVPTGAGSENYTLVYDNYNSDGTGALTDQNDVYIALEFVNGGESFYGRDNLIPHGGVFYLVAKLDKPTAEKASALPWPTDHQIPPVYGVDSEAVPSGKTAGASKQIARVFIQDFMTTATFTLDQNSLKKAYYSVPDLRASQMSLGLSVDLNWIQGLTYNQPL